MKNRKLLLIVSLVLAMAMSLGGTLAYLQDTDEAVNVMTLGNVQIEQIELQRKKGVDYKNGGYIADGDELEPFKQGQALYPAYTDDRTDYTAKDPDDEQFWWGSYVTADVTGNGASNGLFDDGLVGAMDKFVFVKNTGSSPAYYRTWLAFECPEGLVYDDDIVDGADLWLNLNGNSCFDKSENFYVTIDGVRYLVICMTYNKALPAGKISRPSLLQVALTDNTDNADMDKLGNTYEILAFTQAVQTNNMPDYKTALDEAFDPVTTGDGASRVVNHPWTEGVSVKTYDDILYVRQGNTVNVISNGGTTIPRGILSEGGEFDGVKNLVVGDGITTIGYRALKKSTTLESVELASTVTTIDSGAFMECSNLKEFAIPNTVTSIGDSAFYNSGLTEIVLPASITNIEASAFRGTKIETLTIPATVKTIGQYAFRECTALRTVYIEGDNIAFDGSGVFSNTSNWNSGNITIYVKTEAMKAAVEAACKTNASGVVKVIVQ